MKIHKSLIKRHLESICQQPYDSPFVQSTIFDLEGWALRSYEVAHRYCIYMGFIDDKIYRDTPRFHYGLCIICKI